MKIRIFCTLFLIATMSQAQTFIGSFDLITSQINKNGNQRVDSISYYFGETKTAIIIRAGGNQPDLRLIFSPADSTITGLFEIKGNKGGYILPMNKKYWPAMQYALDDYDTQRNTKLNHMGEQKEIEGYECDETHCQNEDFDINVWGTNAIDLNLIQLLAYQTVGAGEDTKSIDMFAKCGIHSFAMETILKGKNDNPDITLNVENLSLEFNSAIFSTEEHTLSDMRKSE